MTVFERHTAVEANGRRKGASLRRAIQHNLGGFWTTVDRRGIDADEVLVAARERSTRLSDRTLSTLRGMAKGAEVDFESLLAFNLFEESIAPDGCTVAIAAGEAAANGETVFFKQSDKKGADEFEGEDFHEHQQINVVHIEEHDDLNNIVAVAAAGSVAVKMGLNDKGVAIGSNISRTTTFDETGKSSKDWAAASRGAYMREGLLHGDTANEVAERIVPLLFDDPMSSPGNIDIADATRAIVIEGEFTHVASEWVEDGVIGRGNKFQVLEQLNRSREEIPSSYCRHERVMEVLEANEGNVTVETLRELSMDHENGPGLNSVCRHQENDYTDETTLSSAIFDLQSENPEESGVYIAMGKACHSWRTDEGDGWVKLTAGATEDDVPDRFLTGEAWLDHYTESVYEGTADAPALD